MGRRWDIQGRVCGAEVGHAGVSMWGVSWSSRARENVQCGRGGWAGVGGSGVLGACIIGSPPQPNPGDITLC